MLREFKVEANVGKPTGCLPRDHHAQTGREGRRHSQEADRWYGSVRPTSYIDPRARPAPGGGYEFVDEITGGVIPRRSTSRPSSQGIQEAMTVRCLAGVPRSSTFGPRLTDGSYHDVDSSEMAFKIAGSMALKKAARWPSPVLLEPVMAG
jgi:elongation factor G